MSDATGPSTLFDYGKAYADLWSLGGKVMLQAQENIGRMFAGGFPHPPGGGAGGAPPAPPDPATAGNAELTRAGQAMAELWSEALSLSGTLTAKLPEGGAADTPAAAALRNMLDPKGWLAATTGMEEAVGRLAEGPRLADLFDVERRYARVTQAWLDLRRRSLEHNAVVIEAWLRAGKLFSEELAGRTGADGRAPDSKTQLRMWTETANRVLLEAQRTESFLQTQAAQIRASTELRMAQRDLVEYYGDRFGFPTRTELDDVHRTVTELRREMRALRRQMRAGAGAPKPLPAGAPPSVAPGGPNATGGR